MSVETLIGLFLPVSLIAMMLGLGASIRTEDLTTVVRRPKPYAAGLFGQLVCLPAAAFACAVALSLPPHLAVGLMLIAAAPGGVSSNVVAFAVRGNTALSVALTLTSSLVGFLTIPLIVQFAILHFEGADTAVRLPVVESLVRIFAITALPVGLGIALRLHRPVWADRVEAVARRSAPAFLAFVLIVIIAASFDFYAEHFASTALGLIAFLALMGVIGWVLAKLAGGDARDQRTLVIEVMLQNTTVAVTVAVTLLDREDYAVVPGVYGVVMFVAVLSAAIRPARGAQNEPGAPS